MTYCQLSLGSPSKQCVKLLSAYKEYKLVKLKKGYVARESLLWLTVSISFLMTEPVEGANVLLTNAHISVEVISTMSVK